MKAILMTLGLMISTQALALPVGEVWSAQAGRGFTSLNFRGNDRVLLSVDPNRCQIDWKGDRHGACTRMGVFESEAELKIVKRDRTHALYEIVGTRYQLVERRSADGLKGSLRLITKSDSGTRVDVLEHSAVQD